MRAVRSVSEAVRAVLERVPRLGVEMIALDDACGRVLAADVIAGRALPGFDNSAMDGYAARSAELPGALPLAGVAAAGGPRTEPVPAGAAVRIFTGAPLPPELDTVVIPQEDARAVGGERIELPASPPGEACGAPARTSRSASGRRGGHAALAVAPGRARRARGGTVPLVARAAGGADRHRR